MQMETFRRVVSGRLSEFAGESRVKPDTFCRMLGLAELRSKAFASLDAEDWAMAQAYADGVNAYIRVLGEDLPLEFQSSDHVPELMAVLERQAIEMEEWADIYPAYPDASLPDDSYIETLRSQRIGKVLPEAFSFFQAMPEQAGGGGTNMRISRKDPGAKPLFANDQHIGATLPNTGTCAI